MKKFIILMLISLGISTPAISGENANALSQCLVSNTTEEDKGVMARWVFQP